MKIHRFIAELGAGNTLTDRELVRQIRKVLKLEPGETICISDGRGADYEGVIEKIDTDTVYLNNITKKESLMPKKNVTLYCAILKKENFELVCQKATELGVTKIVPIITQRTIKQGLKVDRLKKIIKEASEQSGLSQIPILSEALTFSDAIAESLKENEKTFLFDKSGLDIKNTFKSIGLFVGPEGGFTDDEILHAKNLHIEVGSLGITTLRGETAAIVATYWGMQ